MAYIPTMPPSRESTKPYGGSPMSEIPVPAVPVVPPDSAMRVAEMCSADQLPVSDPYAERLRDALHQIICPDYWPGMISWLGSAHPALYAELTSEIPNEIRDLWAERAPLGQFEAVLARLVASHRRCCELYRAKSSL